MFCETQLQCVKADLPLKTVDGVARCAAEAGESRSITGRRSARRKPLHSVSLYRERADGGARDACSASLQRELCTWQHPLSSHVQHKVKAGVDERESDTR